MLSYNKQYDISNGIFLTYDNQLSYRLLHSKHGQAVRDKMKSQFPFNKYETFTKENFIMTCVYLVFTKSPSSYRGLVEELREVDEKAVFKFKDGIINYRQYIRKDAEHIRSNYGANVTAQDILREFTQKNINFYTVHFFLLFHPETNREELKKSRVFGHVIRKLDFIMKFLTFKDESVEYVKTIFKEIEL